METISAVKGFKDILPTETGKWRFVEETAHRVFSSFGFREIRLPILEKTDLFRRGIGETTDIVEKEMYTFLDRGGDYLTLRPEATASIMRAYIEHHLHAADAVAKVYTIGPMFRRERPQKGRYRQFHQIDAEILGYEDPRVDAELILMLVHFLKEVGIADYRLEINSLGCSVCRPAFRETVVAYLQDRKDGLCPDCQRRLHLNPLRTFDCKVAACGALIAAAPLLKDHLCHDCRTHFQTFQECLALFSIPFIVHPRMVRGLDYYMRTAFEVTTSALGAQNAVCGGGRYDGLVRDLGGPDIPGIGFAIGVERLLAMIPQPETDYLSYPPVFIAALGDKAQILAYQTCNLLRLKGFAAEMDYTGRGLKGQMKRADKLGCRYTVMLGDRELETGRAVIRDMKEGTQRETAIAGLEEEIAAMLKENNK